MSTNDEAVAGRLLRLPAGAYEQVETLHVRQQLAAAQNLEPGFEPLSDTALPHQLAVHVGGLLRHALTQAKTPEKQVELVQRVIAALGADYAPDLPVSEPGRPGRLRTLQEIRPAASPVKERLARPATPLSEVALLTNAVGEPSIGAEIRDELASADRVDLLCAFVKWHGLRTLEKQLASLAERQVPFRVITTTYVGATERAALDRIVGEFGGEVRVNYTTASTRLHAKAWLFHRESGWSTAYVGSSNLSKAAMLDGLEWNVRLSSIATPSLVRKFQATFDTYWADPTFEPYDPERDAERLDRELRQGSFTDRGDRIDLSGLDVHPYPHQARMLDDLNAERARGHHRNLLVAATGTGKTVIAGLDYRDMALRAGSPPTLLFVAHREEILRQARKTYRAILNDGTFGELFVGGEHPSQWKHVFASVQSLARLGVATLSPDLFDVVVIDEFHHASASSYEALLRHLRPREVLGLTATPERADGVNVKDLFEGRIASEMRLWDALEADILVPFHYFAVNDDVDLRGIEWRNGQYDVGALGRIYTGDEARARKILAALSDKVSDLDAMKALGFCATVDHAHFMAEVFNRAKVPAAVVVGDTGSEERAAAFRDLRAGTLKVLFGVDVFNEGLDIPEVNTVLFLRPTQSATIFLQQLGRGLRRSPTKSVLTALDFVGHQRKEFRFDLKLRALTGSGRRQLIDDVEAGFPYLPPGSQIVLDRVAEENILANLKNQVGLKLSDLVRDVRDHATAARVGLADYALARYLEEAGRGLEDVYRPGKSGRSWSTVKDLAMGNHLGVIMTPDDRGMTLRAITLRHVDDAERADAYRRLLTNNTRYEELTPQDQQYARMLYFTLLHGAGPAPFSDFDEAFDWVRGLPAFVEEVDQLLDVVVSSARTAPEHLRLGKPTALRSHAHYRRTEILAGLDISSWERTQSSHREGVAFSPDYNTDALLVTLKKDARQFSPSTMYRDFAVSRSAFHWESQNVTTARSPTGQRYLSKEHGESHTLMFVRGSGRDAIGEGAAYLCLGTVQFADWSGTERPMQITWALDREMPTSAYQEARAAS
ncbi:DUF3427 domain-containing protein [Micrococcus luteus]|uniref:DUF3427 domain-containing protein n=1 Tax=Micrococcus luteus TaxID=1270 RepID=UPI0037C5C665